MSDVLVFERAAPSFAANLAQRGHHIVYRANVHNHCPGCGRSQWFIGRISAECGFLRNSSAARRSEVRRTWRRIKQAPLAGCRGHRRAEALSAHAGERPQASAAIDGSPVSFALHNISEGGAMGDGAPSLEPGTAVYVRFEGGILVPAMVKWTEDGMVGLAFTAPIMLDRSADPTN